MSLALTAIFSFVIGLLVAACLLHLFVGLLRGRYAGSFMGGVLRSMWASGLECVVVKTIAHGDVAIDTLDLAVALEATVRDLTEPPDEGGGIEEPGEA